MPYVEQPARDMTTKQISDELDVMSERFREYRDNCEGHQGSPGEWMVERMDELETELKRRTLPPFELAATE